MNFWRRLGRTYGLQVAVLLLVIVMVAATSPTFQGVPAMYAVLERLVLLGIVAAGLAVTMIAGELDMSVASIAVLAGVIAIQAGPLGLIPAIVVATLAGTLLGACQGWAIAKLGINSLVFTVGTLILFRGVAWLAAGGKPISLTNLEATDPLLQRWGIFSPGSLVAIVVLAVLGWFLSRTRFGREIYAIGGARVEATAAGVPVTRSLVIAFTISGTTAALAGALASMKGASVTPDSFGTLLLTAVAACLIGGISLYGGRGNALHVLLGVVTLSIIAAGMSAQGAQSYLTELLTGLLLLIVIGLDFTLRSLSAQRHLRDAKKNVRETTHEPAR